MAEIKLQHGLVTLIDDEDVALVAGYGWYADHLCNTTYARARFITEEGKHTTILMHRLIMGAGKGELIDHKDRNGLNNCKANLRKADKRGNSANSPGSTRGTSKYKGVSWTTEKQRWKAQLKGHIGYFATEELAAIAYNKAALAAFGEFAFLNDVSEVGHGAVQS